MKTEAEITEFKKELAALLTKYDAEISGCQCYDGCELSIEFKDYPNTLDYYGMIYPQKLLS